MQCPRCSTALIVLELNEIEIDYCTDCDGIWLDEGELELMLDDSTQKDKLLHSLKQKSDSKEKPLKCPICSSKMNKAEIDGVEPIVIDECKNYCGLWFDSGELLEVVKVGQLDKENKVIRVIEEMFKNNLKK